MKRYNARPGYDRNRRRVRLGRLDRVHGALTHRFVFMAAAAIIVLAFIAIIIGGAVTGGTKVSNQRTVTCQVTGKDRTTDSDGNSIYRVYTTGGEECTTFEVTDSAWFGNFNSADLFGALHEGQMYRMEITGVRNGFFSMFPTIQKAVEVRP